MECICPILNRSTEVDETGFDRDCWSLVRCRETGFVFLANPPDYSQLESEFAWEETSVEERGRRSLEEPIVSRVSTFAKTVKSIAYPRRKKIASLTLAAIQGRNQGDPLHLLDVGCGTGELMVDIYHRFAKAGRKVIPHGIEVSKRLALISEDRVAGLGGKVIFANAIEGVSGLEPGSMDVVVMHSFLEHECRPLSLLQQLRPVLSPNGRVILKVPNFACWNRIFRGRKWCGFRYPDHVNYFTPHTLGRLTQEAGFTVCRQNFLEKFPLSDNMYAILSKRT